MTWQGVSKMEQDSPKAPGLVPAQFDRVVWEAHRERVRIERNGSTDTEIRSVCAGFKCCVYSTQPFFPWPLVIIFKQCIVLNCFWISLVCRWTYDHLRLIEKSSKCDLREHGTCFPFFRGNKPYTYKFSVCSLLICASDIEEGSRVGVAPSLKF